MNPRICSVVACIAISAPGASAQLHFTDQAVNAGLGSQVHKSNNGHSLGVLWIDVNNDTWVDIFACNGKNLNAHLYLNDQDGTFTRRDDLLPPLANLEHSGAVYADYDNDGDSDIYLYCDHEINELNGVPNPNPPDGPPNSLLKNLWVESGNQLPASGPLFVDVATAAGVDDLAPSPFGPTYSGYRSIAASFIDYDRDGHVDLYMAHWGCGQIDQPSIWDRFFHNNGDGTFTDRTVEVGLVPPTDTERLRLALAMIGGHMDRDLWPDLYVANVHCEPAIIYDHRDLFFRNVGDGTFVDATAESGGLGDDTRAPMGCTLGDPDNDGDWDLYMSDINKPSTDALPVGNPLYLSNGDGTWNDNTADIAGVVDDTSWPVNFFDVDQDGFEDLFVGTTTGEVVNAKNIIYENNQDGTFTMHLGLVGGVLGFGARGSAIADYDKDGDIDLLVVNNAFTSGDPLELYRNDTPNQGHWLQIGFTATESNRSAIGTLVKIRVGNQIMMRQVLGGSSAHSQDSLLVHFGLGAATVVDEIDVFWPSGIVNNLLNVAADQVINVVESDVNIRGYGVGCSIGGTYNPSLHLSGAITPGGTTHFEIVNAYGGSTALLLFGAQPGQTPLIGGCDLLISPVLPLVGVLPLGGSAVGTGSIEFSAQIPATATAGSLTLQAIITKSNPEIVSTTNGVRMTITP